MILLIAATTLTWAYSGGTGTALDPYQIANTADLIDLSNATADKPQVPNSTGLPQHTALLLINNVGFISERISYWHYYHQSQKNYSSPY